MKPSFLLVGLGNPSKQYEATRHNAGWLALDHVAGAWKASEWEDRQKFLCTAAEAVFNDVNVLLVKPTTFMNRSGECIRKLIDYYKLDPKRDLLVVCDDVDLPLGTFRLRMDGGAGTHNGLKSIVECIGESFPRHRIGLGPQPKEIDLAAWVLSAFPAEERKTMQPAIQALEKSVADVLRSQR